MFIAMLLTGIIWLSQSLRFIQFIVNQGLPLGKFIYLTSLMLPALIGILLPVSLFIAVMYAYNRLVTDSELVVMENSGLSHFQLARPAIIFAGLVTMLGWFISLYLLPSSYREFKTMQSMIRNNYAAIFLQEEVFTSPIKDLTVYIGKMDQSGLLSNIFVHDNRKHASPVTMIASESRLEQTAAGPRIVLKNGSRQEVDKARDRLSMLYFDEYTLDLNVFENRSAAKREMEPEERYISELLYPEDTVEEDELKRLRAEAHQRITWPIFSLCLTMIALSFTLGGDFNRRGMLKKIVKASVIGAVALALNFMALNLTYKNNYFALLMYANLLFFIAAPLVILMMEKTRKARVH